MIEIAARQWCQAFARTLTVQHIAREGRPYLDRYFLAGWSPTHRRAGPSVFLHHFLASDATTEVHSHPWAWSCSLILVGGYREDRCVHGHHSEQVYHPGDVNVIEPDVEHRIDLLESDCWTLFLAGAYHQPWTFAPRCEP
jgi:hypothetical protein